MKTTLSVSEKLGEEICEQNIDSTSRSNTAIEVSDLSFEESLKKDLHIGIESDEYSSTSQFHAENRDKPDIDVGTARTAEILELLENAGKLRFLAELKFALNVAVDAGFDKKSHIFHEKYLTFRSLEKELEENDEENDLDAEAGNFGLQTSVDMNISDRLVRIEVRSPYASNITGGEDAENVSIDDSISDFTDPFEGRKIARRKSKAYRFHNEIPATEDDLRQLFRLLSNETGSINAIQLSNLWRVVTSEKGNLFKEMKLFHK